jgi:tRNA A-37 threonylcarbamoyl transferase component Bud32
VTEESETPSAITPFGRYSLLRPIGRGGMAEVWKAKIHGAQNFQRLVVVKRILPHLSSDPEFVRMFTVEAKLSARLNHPNIVQVFEFSEVDGEHYLAMEFVAGVNLGDVQKRLKDVRIPIGMAAHTVREVCLALAYAHALADEDGQRLRIIHRDVSPSNVMLGYDGGVKLLDFGVAKALSQSDELTRTGALKGKVGYMSPEAIEGEVELDGRTDIFAAGVVLWEMLTGRRLFRGHDDLRTIALVRACKVDPPSRERPDVSPELDRIVGKALARARDERYQSADELAADLTRVLRELEWDAFRTAAFLKQHEIRAGNEPELRPRPVLPPDAALAAHDETKGTVLDRPARPVVAAPELAKGGGRLRWAMLGAAGAMAIAGVVTGTAWFLRRDWPTESATGGVPPAPHAVLTPTMMDSPASAVASTTPLGAPPTAVGAAPAAHAAVEPAATGDAGVKRRRRKPLSSSGERPQIDLKRGDVIQTF